MKRLLTFLFGIVILYGGYSLYRLETFDMTELNSLIVEPCVFSYGKTVCIPSFITMAYMRSLSPERFRSRWYKQPGYLEGIIGLVAVNEYKDKRLYILESVELIAEHDVVKELKVGNCTLLDFADNAGDLKMYDLVKDKFFQDLSEKEALNPECKLPRYINDS